MTKQKKKTWTYRPSELTFHLAGSRLQERTLNTLAEAGISKLGELLQCCPLRSVDCTKGPGRQPCENLHLLDVPNVGDKTIEEIFSVVAELGFER